MCVSLSRVLSCLGCQGSVMATAEVKMSRWCQPDRRDRLRHDQSDRRICGRVRGDNNPFLSWLCTETFEHLCGLKVQSAKGESPGWWLKSEHFEQPSKSSSIFQKIK